uniref:Putative tumor necrosis factor receptor n=1 Tax=Ixodes ricinus TaxID=34613 RepID=A0A131Y774_IXORI
METHMQELREQSAELMNVTKSVSDCVLGFYGAKEFHWYFKGWTDLKMGKIGIGYENTASPLQYVCGYNVCLRLEILWRHTLRLYMCIHPGVNDSKLEWPFSKTYTLGVIHPKDKAKRKTYKVDASKYSDNPSFQIPKQGGNIGFGTLTLSTANELEREGFVNDDSLHCFLQVEP